MKLSLRNRVLVPLVLVLAVLNLYWVKGKTQEAVVQPLFEGLEPASVARFTIRDPQGQGVTLRLNKDEVWVVEERFGWRAYGPAVQAFLRGLSSATDGEPEATLRSSHAALGVDSATGNRIRLLDRDRKVLADLIQGAPPDRTRGSRLLPLGQDTVYRTPTVPRVVPDPARWIDGDILPFEANDIDVFSLALHLPDGSFQEQANLVRQENGRFAQRLSQRSLPPASATPFLQALESLVVRDVVAAPREADSDGLDGATLLVEFESIAGRSGGWGMGSLRVGFDDSFADGDLAAGSTLVALRGLGLDPDEVRWFVMPNTSAKRLTVLAQRLLVAAGQ